CALRAARGHTVPFLRIDPGGPDDGVRAQRLSDPDDLQEREGPVLPRLWPARVAADDQRDAAPGLARRVLVLHRAGHGARQPDQPPQAHVTARARTWVKCQAPGGPRARAFPAPGRLRLYGRDLRRP